MKKQTNIQLVIKLNINYLTKKLVKLLKYIKQMEK